ncbi:MAG TPA: hypothetical protein VGX69_05440 [Solirubrobacteraceae bacterium]|jgi:hypothetical protein|nr:hypothetical protein [Solirubrobacteraceae bacterium]
MSSRSSFIGLIVAVGLLLIPVTPAHALVKVFAPNGGNVTGTGGEAVFFGRITCSKFKASGKINRSGTEKSKVLQEVTYEGCMLSLLKVKNFTVMEQSLNLAKGGLETNSISFHSKVVIEVEGENQCEITIPNTSGTNLLLPGITFTSEPGKKVKAAISVAKGAGGLKFETNKSNCGPLEKEEAEEEGRGSYKATETVEPAEIVEI